MITKTYRVLPLQAAYRLIFRTNVKPIEVLGN